MGAEEIEVNFREMADESGVTIKHDPNGVAVSTYTITKADGSTVRIIDQNRYTREKLGRKNKVVWPAFNTYLNSAFQLTGAVCLFGAMSNFKGMIKPKNMAHGKSVGFQFGRVFCQAGVVASAVALHLNSSFVTKYYNTETYDSQQESIKRLAEDIESRRRKGQSLAGLDYQHPGEYKAAMRLAAQSLHESSDAEALRLKEENQPELHPSIVKQPDFKHKPDFVTGNELKGIETPSRLTTDAETI